MGLFKALTRVCGAFRADIVSHTTPQSPYLLDVLVDGVPKQATLLPPEPTALGRGQQMQAVSSKLDQQASKIAERKANRDLVIAVGSFSLAMAGALFAPPLGILSLLGSFYGSRHIFKNSYTTLVQKRRVTLDLLNALLITLLIGNGSYVLCNLPIVLSALRRKLVSKIKNDSRGAIVDVFHQQPRFASVLIDDVVVEVPYATLCQGQIVVVNAGETIPIDGVILAGAATIDQQMLTGEAQPVEKGGGDPVFALTVVLSGQLQIQLEKTGKATTAAQIGETLNQTIDFKTDAHLWAEETVDRMVLPTLLLGGLTFPLVGLAGLTAILNAPPAHNVSIASATCMLSYLNLASKRGILIKDGRILEALTQVDTVVFDKTGTLTQEQPEVGRIYTFKGMSETELLRYTAAAERHQSHPIARAIRQEAVQRGLDLPLLTDAQTKVGYGVSVFAEARSIQVGSLRFMEELGLALPPEVSTAQTACHSQGYSLILVAIDGQLAGALELRPAIRPEAQAVIQGLHQRKIKMCIISGDHVAPTKCLATALGIDDYYAEVLPTAKAALIEELQQAGRTVCFVGDGINDSIALKKANVSISLKGASSVALDTAQVILMDQSLTQLCQLFDLAQAYKAKMRSTFWLVVTPSLIALSGAMFMGFGFVACILLNQLGFLTSTAHVLAPLLSEKQKALPQNV